MFWNWITNNKNNFVYCRCQADELGILWQYRHYLCDQPNLLPWILQGQINWDFAHLSEVYDLLGEWKKLFPMQALELLLPQYAYFIVLFNLWFKLYSCINYWNDKVMIESLDLWICCAAVISIVFIRMSWRTIMKHVIEIVNLVKY